MAFLTKYKRDGRIGFEELLREMEGMSTKAYKIRMETIEAEDAGYAQCIKNSLFRFEEFNSLTDGEIAELISHVRPLNQLVISLCKMEDEINQKFIRNMDDRTKKEFTELTEDLSGITVGGRHNMQVKVVKIARELEKEGVIKLKPMDYWSEQKVAA